ncbi:hypothetical protein [Amycolatopsis sp. GM8]|uniref:hypothetical protein n=1 Tax=Amycolatopsis sp. GM8 TaxID=2896530 RepID=UPI001F205720|nr:hypothetical protein [Amycolatopsis sp. GM8]
MRRYPTESLQTACEQPERAGSAWHRLGVPNSIWDNPVWPDRASSNASGVPHLTERMPQQSAGGFIQLTELAGTAASVPMIQKGAERDVKGLKPLTPFRCR